MILFGSLLSMYSLKLSCKLDILKILAILLLELSVPLPCLLLWLESLELVLEDTNKIRNLSMKIIVSYSKEQKLKPIINSLCSSTMRERYYSLR